jgi:hypothetical protein
VQVSSDGGGESDRECVAGCSWSPMTTNVRSDVSDEATMCVEGREGVGEKRERNVR